MPRKSGQVPAYRLHKPSGQARVIISGQHIYLGRYGSSESREKYSRIIAEMAVPGQNGGNLIAAQDALPQLSVEELILRYWRFAETYYCQGGQPTQELGAIRDALRPLRRLYGNTPAGEFGPKALRAVRQQMIDSGLSRGLINRRVGKIKRVFKWGVSEELIPPSVHHGLQTLVGLRHGRTSARESEPVRPVDDKWVNATLPYVSPQVSTMIQIQRLTGMRPCELIIMRPCDIDMEGDIWVYEPYEHKNKWRGHERKIPLGPKAQMLLRPFLDRPPTTYLFSPEEAEQWRHAELRRNRQSPLTPSQRKRKPKRNRKKAPGDRYRTTPYSRAISYGIKKANKNRDGKPEIPHWFPLQLRHTRATEVRREYGLDAAQVALGHAHADVTQVYAERNLALATKIAEEIG